MSDEPREPRRRRQPDLSRADELRRRALPNHHLNSRELAQQASARLPAPQRGLPDHVPSTDFAEGELQARKIHRKFMVNEADVDMMDRLMDKTRERFGHVSLMSMCRALFRAYEESEARLDQMKVLPVSQRRREPGKRDLAGQEAHERALARFLFEVIRSA